MFSGNNCLFQGNRAAIGRTIFHAACMRIPGADTVDPGNLLWFLAIGKTFDMTLEGAAGTENAFEFQGGDDVGVIIGIIIITAGIEGLKTRGQDYRSHLDVVG